jgi:hypothetical protein
MTKSGLFHGGSLGRRWWCLLLSICVFCFLTPYVNAHGGGSGSGGSGSGSGSSGSSGSGGSGGHGGPGGSMGSSSAAPGGFTGGGSGHGGSGHASSSTSAHGTAVSHSTTMATAKNSVTHNQVRNGFTSDTMLQRSSDRIRSRQTTSTGGFNPETYPRKKLKTSNALATKNATQNSAAR